jgi:hypothetical protein
MEQKYIDGSPTVELLSYEAFVYHAQDSVSSENVYADMYPNEFIELASQIGFLLPKNNTNINCYEVNQCHELYSIIKHPHSDRILDDRLALGILYIISNKTYLQCVSTESFKSHTGYKKQEIEDTIQELKHLRMIESTMIIKGEGKKINVVENANKIFNRIDEMSSLLNDNEMISTEKLQGSIGELPEPDKNDDSIICLTEQELKNRMKEAIRNGSVDNIKTPNSISTLEKGDKGYRWNEDSEFVQKVRSLEMNLLEHIDEINEYLE